MRQGKHFSNSRYFDKSDQVTFHFHANDLRNLKCIPNYQTSEQHF